MNTKVMKVLGTLIIGLHGATCILSIIQIDNIQGIGNPAFGKYSIFSSRDAFMVYQVWGIILSIAVIYAMWKEIRMLFMIGFLLIGIHLFYPSLTQNQVENPTAPPPADTTQVDQSPKAPSVKREDPPGPWNNNGKGNTVPPPPKANNQPVSPPPMDQLSGDVPEKDS